jgi:hypothetical protein
MFLKGFQRETAIIEVSKGKLSARLEEELHFDDQGTAQVTLNLVPTPEPEPLPDSPDLEVVEDEAPKAKEPTP